MQVSREAHPNPFFYGLIKIVLFILYRLFFRFKGFKSNLVPDETDKRGVILAPNHASFLDPPILGISLKRRVTYLAKEYLFRAFFVGWVLRSIGALPIKTEGRDFKSIRDLLRVLTEGKCVVVFPEGTRSLDGNFKNSESGVGFLAVKSQAWVVPVYIQGTFAAFPKGAKWFKCRPVKVFYGEAFIAAMDKGLMSQEDRYMAVSNRIMSEIKKIKSEVE